MTRERRASWWQAVVAAGTMAVFLSGCAGGRTGVTRGSAERPLDAAPAPDWEHPLGGLGKRFAASRDAARYVSFTPLLAVKLGRPTSIFVSDPGRVPRSDRAFSLVFDSTTYGRYDINEQVSHTNQQELESLVGCDHATGCEGSWSVVEIGNGVRALLVAGPRATSVTWLDGTLRIDVLGPASTFSADAAKRIGRVLVEAARRTPP